MSNGIFDQSIFCPFSPLPHNPEFNIPEKKGFENIVEKAEGWLQLSSVFSTRFTIKLHG